MSTYKQDLTGLVNKPFHSIPFEVDNDYNWMDITISFSIKGWYSIFIWDPKKVLRSQVLYIEKPRNIRISKYTSQTSFSSVQGEITQGEWIIEIEGPSYQHEPSYLFNIECGHTTMANNEATDNWTSTQVDSGFELNLYDPTIIYKKKRDWYKGDFHTHTNLSDGKLTPEQGMEQAKKMQLDYFVATDHNIIPTKWVKDDVLVIPGIEITSSKGHFNALGLTKWVNWRPSSADGGMETEDGMNRVIQDVKQAGAIVSINHPMLEPWEWQFKQTLLSEIDTIEIWNDPTYKDNLKATEEALALWNILWNDGYRIFGIGGSDSHLLPTESYEENGPPSVIGDPATFVHTDELSAKAILTAVKSGRTYVSRGPVLDINIEANRKQIEVGSNLTQESLSECGLTINYQLSYKHVPEGSTLFWVQDGEVIHEDNLDSAGQNNRSFIWKQDQITWLRFEIRSKDGELLAFCNPIYQGEKSKSILTWGQLLETLNK